jgi:hypothetical protein
MAAPLGKKLAAPRSEVIGMVMSRSNDASLERGEAVPSSQKQMIQTTIGIQMVVHLAFQLPEAFTRLQLFQALKQWEFETFAAAAFRKHRTGSLFQKRIVPLDVLSCFSATPLRKPLLQSVPGELKTKASLLFDLLLQWTTVKTCSSPNAVRAQILQILSDNPGLVDEFYFQLIKQTISNHNYAYLTKTWELFMLAASVFPAGPTHYMWILAHIARATADSDHRISGFATFIFIRFQARYYLQTVFDWNADRHWLDDLPSQATKGKAVFGVQIYEILWCQRAKYPKLPIPYVLHHIVGLLLKLGALLTPNIFMTQPPKGLLAEILRDVNQDMSVLSRGDVNVMASLLVTWLKELPNPVVPVELVNSFLQMAQDDKFLGFAEALPQAHRLVLLYVIGFLQEVFHNAHHTGVEKDDLAKLFGPAIVNPERLARDDENRQAKLHRLSIAFVTKLIERADPSIIYPLSPAYLTEQQTSRVKRVVTTRAIAKAPGKVARGSSDPIRSKSSHLAADPRSSPIARIGQGDAAAEPADVFDDGQWETYDGPV